MTITKDHSNLRVDHREWPPDTEPRFGPLLAEAWRAENEAEFERSKRFDTKMRLSKVGQCARSTGYEVQGVEKSDPMTVADHWRTGLGTMVHTIIGPVIAKAFPGAELEFAVDCRTDEQYPADISGSGDVTLTYVVDTEQFGNGVVSGNNGHIDPPRRVVIEVKTIGGFGFKVMTGARKGDEGPKHGHLVQAALEAHFQRADELVILYLALELLSPREAVKLGVMKDPREVVGQDDTGRFIAEYTLTRDQYEPIAQAELRRQQKIIDRASKGELLPRQVPELGAHARVVDPMHGIGEGRWELLTPDGKSVQQSGTYWGCGYCPFRHKCVEDGAS